MNDENTTLKCQHCDIHAVRLYTVVTNTKDVCKKCKHDHEEHGKFTRDKVKHDYSLEKKKRNIYK